MPEDSILGRIVERRRRDVADSLRRIPHEELEQRVSSAPPALDFPGRLRRAGPMAIIGEIKRASPSKGEIAPRADAAALARAYAAAGAAGISVLTEPHWFHGSLADLEAVRNVCDSIGQNRPGILRKDFILSDYQVLEARAAGADSVLLIVASLPDSDLASLMQVSRSLGMEPLVEVNNHEDLRRALAAGASFIGINNRDLHSFRVDLDTTEKLAGSVPDSVLLAGLSGVRNHEDVMRFAASGAAAALVGEALMLAPDPAAKIRELLGSGVAP